MREEASGRPLADVFQIIDAVTIIEEYRYGLSAPSGGEDESNGMVSIDIARFDQEPANRTDTANRLPTSCRKLKLNPVVGRRRVALRGLNAGFIGTKAPVKIGNRNSVSPVRPK